jgi:hypothetical protein
MSVDERCTKFATDAAAKPLDAKGVATLRKFLYRNQETRLTAAGQQALCDAVVKYASAGNEDAIPLLEDALAMTFNVFTTAHKKQLLKHLDRLRGEADGDLKSSGTKIGTKARRKCLVLDVSKDCVVEVLLNQDGDTTSISRERIELEEGSAETLKKAFDDGEDVEVFVEGSKAEEMKIVEVLVSDGKNG